jgi:cystine transport system permease protein
MYVSIFRGTPLLVQILLIYFGLPHYGITLSPIPSALLALTLFSAAYLSENFRSGINAVDPGQWEASLAMGMGYWTCLRRIILPQAVRIALPPVGSRLIALIKDTSLASTITVVEMTRVAEQVGAATFRYMEMFLMIGFVYWLINQVLTLIQTYLEGRMTRRYR